MSSALRPTSLFFKIILITSLILIIVISFSVWMNIRIHKASIARHTYDRAKIISEFIEKNVIRAMEKGRHFEIHSILKNFTYRGVWKISLFRPDGVIRASTYEEELNKNVGGVEFYLNNQYFIREEMIRLENGKRGWEKVYYFNTPILNHPECYQCHNKKEKIVGILTVANSLKEMDKEISKVKKDAIVLAVITIGSLSSVLGLLFLRFVNLPITRLTDTMRRVEEGDLDVKVTFEGKDEMGRLAKNLNTMIEKLNLAKKEAEQYHQELVQRADRMATIGELASGIAHEIRNPLAGIHGAIQIIVENLPQEDDRRQVMDEIQKQIHRLERLVKDLLNYAKPAHPQYLPTDMNELVTKVLSFFLSRQGISVGIKIEKKLFDPIPTIMVDPNSMEQVFLNIVLNAQKAMPKGGTLTVSTRYLSQHNEGQGEVQIIFEDTGIGIRKENLPKIFDPFFSTRSDGTGLGLSITRNIIEQHGGRIEVESQVNVGTKFTITLPAIN
ncbi:MAG: ATP-binding protein [Deltaproteobacteria bacterium]|nr:ATP-binding protein [Deltaproteobacteria bacterium]